MLTVDPKALDAAIVATFERRKTPVTASTPPGLTEAFANDPHKVSQWRAYTESLGIEAVPLGEVIAQIWANLKPSCERIGSIGPA